MKGRLSRGFTLIEILLVITILAIFFSLTTINLLSSKDAIDIDSITNTLAADLKAQQIKSMSGDGDGGSSALHHGVFIDTSEYILFAGDSYNPADPNNFIINMPDGLYLNTTFPSNQITFTRKYGDVNNFVQGQNTIEISSTPPPSFIAVKTLTINTLGALDIN